MSLTSAAVGGWPLYPPGKRPETNCAGRRVGPRAGVDGCGKSRPTMYVFAYWPDTHTHTIPSEEKRNIRKLTYSQIEIYAN